MILVVMGVSGSGKTRIGSAVATRLGWPFLDADDYHPQSNIDKMRAGVPLDDADRVPWLAALRTALAELEERDAVLACSALRHSFREALAEGFEDVRFVYLRADPHVVTERLRARRDHFMPAALLPSQFETLEEPEGAVVVDGAGEVEEIVGAVIRGMKDEG